MSTDVVEISSAESDDETEEATKLNKTGADEDDNFADCHNCPDKQGRVLVNVGHPADENDIYLNPRLAASVKRHQVSSSIILVVLDGLLNRTGYLYVFITFRGPKSLNES